MGFVDCHSWLLYTITAGGGDHCILYWYPIPVNHYLWTLSITRPPGQVTLSQLALSRLLEGGQSPFWIMGHQQQHE